MILLDMVGDADQQIYKEQNSTPALLDAIWAGLSEANGDWHDMNPMQGLSIWEARDGSALLMAFADDVASTLCELSVQAGVARDYLQPIAQQFGLVQL